MDNKKAEELLIKVKGLQKQANQITNLLSNLWDLSRKTPVSSGANWLKGTFTEKAFDNPHQQELYDQLVTRDANKEIQRVLLGSAGLGAAVRGFHGLTNVLADPKPYTPSRVIDLPIVQKKEKQEKEKKAYYSKYDVPYYLPSMLVGAPLAAYGSWQAVDAVLDKQRRSKLESELEDAKARYEKALLGNYKAAVDNNLTSASKLVEKSAFNIIPKPLQNAYLAYALASAPLAYYGMNNYLNKNSTKALLERAVKERAMQRSAIQPPEIYAHIEEPEEAE
jgi:hypothetical protein